MEPAPRPSAADQRPRQPGKGSALVRYAVPQRVQNSRWQPHTGLSTAPQKRRTAPEWRQGRMTARHVALQSARRIGRALDWLDLARAASEDAAYVKRCGLCRPVYPRNSRSASRVLRKASSAHGMSEESKYLASRLSSSQPRQPPTTDAVKTTTTGARPGYEYTLRRRSIRISSPHSSRASRMAASRTSSPRST